MNNLHIPILTLIDRVNKIKTNHSYLKNDHINYDLESIVKELQVIVEEEQTYSTNTLDGYNKHDADLFLGRNLSDDEWYDLKEILLSNDYLWEQVGEYANDWITDEIIAKENK